MNKNIKIIGIDPGYGRIGYGIIEKTRTGEKYITHGLIETSTKKELIDRLGEIHTELSLIIKKYKPDSAAVEKLFFYKNVKTAIDVGQARGVILLTLKNHDLPISEYTPLEIKQAIVGYGRAEKNQIQTMVQMILGLKKQKMQDDAADALAVALTCSSHLR